MVQPHISLFVWFYLMSIVALLFSSNVLFHCGLLVINSLWGILMMYGMVGFSWYLLVMFLVYVGGVYILLLFVSIHNPNSVHGLGLGFTGYFFGGFFMWEVSNGFNELAEYFGDFSFNFCSGLEGFTYLFLCFFLVLGFFLVSFISSSKESFIR
nr:NADH dehydrogenase subunit 6 [Cichlidogyrus casuarinus]